MKKAAPYIFLAILAIVAIVIKQCNNKRPEQPNKPVPVNPKPVTDEEKRKKIDRNTTDLFFTKHARCRMECRRITQKEVKEILANGTINYNKSDLNASDGPKYAVEGVTSDKQNVRVIFAPKQKHMTVVTVIDLENEWACPSCN